MVNGWLAVVASVSGVLVVVVCGCLPIVFDPDIGRHRGTSEWIAFGGQHNWYNIEVGPTEKMGLRRDWDNRIVGPIAKLGSSRSLVTRDCFSSL